MQKATATVVPSQWLETFGLVVIESMAAGVVPIAPDHASFPELIHHNVDGILYRPNDPKALADVFHTLDSDSSHFSSMRARALRTYEERFGPRQTVAALESIYTFAIEHPVWEMQPLGVTTGDVVPGRTESRVHQ